MSEHLMKNYRRLAVEFERGEGAWLWDTQGKRYLDALSGIAVCGLGHAHPAVSRAVAQQAARLTHTSNLYAIGLQEKLAKRLTSISGLDQVFFCNSGAEANEAAIKLARVWARQNDNPTPLILTMEGAFHGRTLGSLAASSASADSLFAPLPAGFVQIPFDDITAVENALSEHPNICAVMVEPIQGEGGVRVTADGYLRQLRAVCTQHEVLLIFDEVQTGVGRTGAWYCFQHEHACPDILTTAKALGNGIPIAACLARASVAESFQPGTHGSTFGGNPVACAAALAVLETMQRDRVCAQAATLGDYLLKQLRAELGDIEGVVSVRGKGLMIGVELDRACQALMQQALDRGLLINVTAERVVRLLPPLILEREQADIIVATLAELIAARVSATTHHSQTHMEQGDATQPVTTRT